METIFELLIRYVPEVSEVSTPLHILGWKSEQVLEILRF